MLSFWKDLKRRTYISAKNNTYLQTSNTSSSFKNIWGGKHTSPQKKWVPSQKRPIPLAILYFLNRSGVADIMCCAEFVTDSYVEFVTYSCVDDWFQYKNRDSFISELCDSFYVKFVTHLHWECVMRWNETHWYLQFVIHVYAEFVTYSYMSYARGIQGEMNLNIVGGYSACGVCVTCVACHSHILRYDVCTRVTWLEYTCDIQCPYMECVSLRVHMYIHIYRCVHMYI